jgi:diacylglycerol kinase family enzyme
MLAGPEAKTDDGVFDLTVVGDFSKAESLASGRLLYSGKIYTHPKVRHATAKRVEVRPLDGRVLVEADGEQPGILPATWTILPGAVRLKVPGVYSAP